MSEKKLSKIVTASEPETLGSKTVKVSRPAKTAPKKSVTLTEKAVLETSTAIPSEKNLSKIAAVSEPETLVSKTVKVSRPAKTAPKKSVALTEKAVLETSAAIPSEKNLSKIAAVSEPETLVSKTVKVSRPAKMAQKKSVSPIEKTVLETSAAVPSEKTEPKSKISGVRFENVTTIKSEVAEQSVIGGKVDKKSKYNVKNIEKNAHSAVSKNSFGTKVKRLFHNKIFITVTVLVLVAVLTLSIVLPIVFSRPEESHETPIDSYLAGELKDVSGVKVYLPDSALPVREIDARRLDKYIAVIQSESMPSMYAKISAYDSSTNLLTLKIDGVKQSVSGTLSETLIAPFEVPQYKPLLSLITQIRDNVSGMIELESDYDGSDLPYNPSNDATAYVTEIFTGTIRGNGHKIVNLNAPLLLKTVGAEISSLVIENANLNSGSNRGGRTLNAALVLEAVRTRISDVHIADASGTSASWFGPVQGVLAGSLFESTVTGCSVRGMDLKPFYYISGGIAGKAESSVIADCYAEGTIGKISAGYTSSTFVGGIVGKAAKTSVKGCIVDVKITCADALAAVGLLVGYADANSPIENCLIAGAVNNGNKVTFFDGQQRVTNSYVNESARGKNYGGEGVAVVADSELAAGDFFTARMPIGENFFDRSFMNRMGRVMMKGAYPAKEKINTLLNGAYIPRYDELYLRGDFSSQREMLYSNAAKLSPYAMLDSLLDDANRSPTDGAMNQKNVKRLLPLAGDQAAVMTSDRYQSADALLVIYEDGTREQFSLANPRLILGGIPLYDLPELHLTYAYGAYAAPTDSETANYIRNTLDLLDYETDLLPLVGGRDVNGNIFAYGYAPDGTRLCSESDMNMLDETFGKLKTEGIEPFILRLLSSSVYSIPQGVKGASTLQRNLVKENLNRLLYAYSYYKTWYDIDFCAYNLADGLFFDGVQLGKNFDTDTATEAVLGATRGQRTSNKTGDFYRERLAPYTGIAATGDFLETLVKEYTGLEDYNEWFKLTFTGLTEEAPAYNLPDVKYKVWEQVKKNSILNDNMALPSLSKGMNNEDLFIMGVPSQVIYGSLSGYSDFHKENGRGLMKNRLSQFAKQLTDYYVTTASFVTESNGLLKNISQLQLDSFKEETNLWITPPESKYPSKKYFMQAMKLGGSPNGSGAYANGSIVCWVAYRFIGDIGTFTHESAHNQDGRYLLENQGRRAGTGAESYATGMFEQGASGNSVAFNFANNYTRDKNVAFNYSLARIQGKENIRDFYQKYYEAVYTLELLELKAMLSLDKQVQSALIYQHSYPKNEEGVEVKGKSVWKPLPLEAYAALNVRSYTDLIKNRLNITRNFTAGSETAVSSTYTLASMSTDCFFAPYNDGVGNSDYFTFKRFGTELLGKYGYSKGFVGYVSNAGRITENGSTVSNDVTALRYASGDRSMTYDKFQTQKYAVAETKLNTTLIPHMAAADVVQMFKEKLMIDYNRGSYDLKPESGNLRTTLLKMWMRHTDEYRSSIYDGINEKTVSTASELARCLRENPAGNYSLGADLDFTGVEPQTAAIADVIFTGRINGRGHVLKGLTVPLVKRSVFAYYSDLTFLNATAPSNKLNLVTAETSMSVYCRIAYRNDWIFSNINEIK